jgi:hypothetical protein
LSSVATSSSCAGEWTDRSVPLGKYWRSNSFDEGSVVGLAKPVSQTGPTYQQGRHGSEPVPLRGHHFSSSWNSL